MLPFAWKPDQSVSSFALADGLSLVQTQGPDTGWTNHNHASDMERFQYDDWQRSTAKAVLLTTKLDAAAEVERTVEAILTALLLLHTSCSAPQDKQSNRAVKMRWELRANEPDVSSEGCEGQNRAEREEREY